MIMRVWVSGGLRPRHLPILAVAALLASGASDAFGQAWMTYSHNAQHSNQSAYASQVPQQVRWSTPVDLNPQYTGGGSLLTHYGTPLITSQNVVIVPVKVNALGDFRVEARRGTDGSLLWRVSSDYVLPAFNWIPPFNPTLVPNDTKLVIPAAGGTVLVRTNPNGVRGSLGRLAFFGIDNYNRNPAAFNTALRISTPITSDASGNLFFGYLSSGAALPGYPNGIPSGLARIGADGAGRFVAASSLSGDAGFPRIAGNCTPAVTADGSTVYVGVNSAYSGGGFLCRANASDLSPLGRVRLIDPSTGNGARVTSDGTSSPTIGPDGDVYYGVLESNFPQHHARGWMLHFNATLTQSKTPGSFGWDDTPSIVPASAVPSYQGSSSYLILTKYNNYSNPGIGGDGLNSLAVLDPNDQTQSDPILSSVTVMKEILKVLSPTPNPEGLPGVTEWCISACAIDAANHCAVVNNEDGKCYRWDFNTNTLTPGLQVAAPTGEAYTPTMIGPDGAAYCINNARLNCCVANPPRRPRPSRCPRTRPAPPRSNARSICAGRNRARRSRRLGSARSAPIGRSTDQQHARCSRLGTFPCEAGARAEARLRPYYVPAGTGAAWADALGFAAQRF
ncbi:MAG: hypothetical protein U0790_23220 [Isosphaeraceae bacterium]